MPNYQRFGIIDIGSNSVRLVIYELVDQNAYRVVDEFKESVRLSAKIGEDGCLPSAEIESLGSILHHFAMLCSAHRVTKIRAVATAAIRNARNREEIVQSLERRIGLPIEVLTGEDEARLGFLGMINTLEIEDGFLIDIGGGSTEVSLFRKRRRVHSVSFPFGAVNTTRRFADDGQVREAEAEQVRDMIQQAVQKEPWIMDNPGLPLIGIGGTMRSLCKISQNRNNYSLPLTHNYTLPNEEVEYLLKWLLPMNAAKRKSVDGISKNRSDIIGCGLLILHTIAKLAGSTQYITSGSGLKDGVFFETLRPARAQIDNVLEQSVQNLLVLHPSVPLQHVKQVQTLADRLFTDLCSSERFSLDESLRYYLEVAALLYRIGTTVDYYKYDKHTFYLLAHSPINGLTHREKILCGLIACFHSKQQTRVLLSKHKDIVSAADLELAVKLGTLLRVAIALDRSETQPIKDVRAVIADSDLHIHLYCKFPPLIEIRELESLTEEFKKAWGLTLHAQVRKPVNYLP